MIAATPRPSTSRPARIASRLFRYSPAVPAMAGEGAVPSPISPHIHTEETRVAADSAAPDDQQSAYYRVYQEFVLARERCQESVEGLNFELFRQRLQQSRDQIMSQHSCQTVQFHVHVKDGRATPNCQARPSS